ncbi:MAG: hypothetical protein KJN79_00210 [Gammaproteobacteria bacterium]|nr:hypothetical protein [Gammaproteobacteria bacterium]
MKPTVFSMGQGPRLVAGLPRRGLVAIDTSAFTELSRPAQDPGPVVPGELPIRDVSGITKGLGLSYEAERDLTRALEQWMDAPDPVQFRGRLVRGMRGFAPDNYGLRTEVWRRAATLYRSRNPMRRRIPGSVVVQKGERDRVDRWKAGEWLRLNPNPTDAQVHDYARESGMGKDRLEELIYELATDHAQQHMGKGEQIPGGEAAGMNPEDFDVEQLAVGTHHELEHTASRALAMEIAMDHLAEDADYYRKLKQIEKSEDGEGWGPMPGIDGGLRRMVPGGYEYRFPTADLADRGPVDIGRVLNQRPAPQPPELVFAYPDDEPFEKGAQHKYIRRVPTGKQRPKYRYIYKLPQRKGLVVDEHLVAGSKFKVSHAGQTGHFEVLEHDEKKGLVKVKHDESGRTAHLKKRDLHRMLQAHHAKQGRAAAEKTPESERAGAPGSLPRVQMSDLARGEWTETVGFEPTEDAALALVGALKKGWDYAAIKQPSGYLVVARKKQGTKKAARELHGAPVDVHLRGEKTLKATYTLMEADDVIASHDPVNFNVRKDYPEGVQEREYHVSKHEQLKVLRIAQDIKPVFVINNNPDGVNGSPIVTQDGTVLGGNARTMGIQRAYAQEPGSAKKYKDHLIAHARDYGFTALDVRGMKNPVLVRRTKVDRKKHKTSGNYTAQLRKLGRRMNEGLTQGLDPRAEEVALGKNFVNERMLRALTDKIPEGETLRRFLETEQSRPFVKELWAAGIIDNLNAGQLTYSNQGEPGEALLNREGRQRIERVLVAKVIDSPTLLDGMSPTQLDATANSIAHILSAQQSGWDIAADFKRAVQIDQSIQKMAGQLGTGKKALDKFLSGKQRELPGVSGMAQEVRQNDMLRHLLVIVREKVGTRTMPRDFLGFALRAREDAKHNPELTGQTEMFGGAFAPRRESPAEALDIEFGVTPVAATAKRERAQAARQAEKEEKERQAEQRQRVAAGAAPTPAPTPEPTPEQQAQERMRQVQERHAASQKPHDPVPPRATWGWLGSGGRTMRASGPMRGRARWYQREKPGPMGEVSGTGPIETVLVFDDREYTLRAKKDPAGAVERKIFQLAALAPESEEIAASMGMDPPDLVKAVRPNRLVTRAIHHVEHLVDAAVSTSMLEYGEIRVNGARIVQRVLADVDRAVRRDPELAREQGKSPVDAAVVRGLIEAVCQMRGKDLVSQ